MVKNQKGQMIIEAILILVIFLGASRLVANYFKDNELVKKLVRGPWTSLESMIETGRWYSDVEGARQFHPNYNNMHVSLEGDPAE
ncbi:MAG: hypothetical protein KDD50_06745 [Bdellovibrionales bacterium]|nr:hypothetical protein [Bdellovibrionales bacterium]